MTNSHVKALKERLHHRACYLFWGIYLLFFLVIAFARSQGNLFGSDFYTYYTSGEQFATGNPLYNNIATGVPFLYPPFAAALFHLMNIFPLSVAAMGGIFFSSILLLYLVALSYYLTSRKRESAAAAVFVLGTMIKVLPIFFLYG